MKKKISILLLVTLFMALAVPVISQARGHGSNCDIQASMRPDIDQFPWSTHEVTLQRYEYVDKTQHRACYKRTGICTFCGNRVTCGPQDTKLESHSAAYRQYLGNNKDQCKCVCGYIYTSNHVHTKTKVINKQKVASGFIVTYRCNECGKEFTKKERK